MKLRVGRKSSLSNIPAMVALSLLLSSARVCRKMAGTSIIDLERIPSPAKREREGAHRESDGKGEGLPDIGAVPHTPVAAPDARSAPLLHDAEEAGLWPAGVPPSPAKRERGS